MGHRPFPAHPSEATSRYGRGAVRACGSIASDHYEIGEYPKNKTLNLPMSCMHCTADDAECVTVCPTGASYKRAEDGIVLIDQDKCMGCNLCAWACPYGARELDTASGTMKSARCVSIASTTELPVGRTPARSACLRARRMRDASATLDDPESVVSRLTAERGGFGLMPSSDTLPSTSLPPREPKAVVGPDEVKALLDADLRASRAP